MRRLSRQTCPMGSRLFFLSTSQLLLAHVHSFQTFFLINPFDQTNKQNAFVLLREKTISPNTGADRCTVSRAVQGEDREVQG